MYDCTSELDCNVVSYPSFRRHFLFYAIAALAYGTRLPERLLPGVFDFFGQSHHFLHIVGSIGTMDEYTAIYLDMLGRRKAMENLSIIPSIANCLCVTLLVVICNIAVVFWFAASVDKTGEREAEGKGN